MSIFYLDYANGNDANDGSNWANAWKTFKDGATAARIAPGDEVRVAKSPDAVSLGNAAWTKGNATVTLAAAATKTVTNCESAWTAVSGDVECTTPGAIIEGSYCARINVKSTFGTGKAAYFGLGSAQDFSSYQRLSFWMRWKNAITAGYIKLCLCSDTTGDTIVDEFALPFTTDSNENSMTVFTINKGSALGSSIQSIALYVVTDLGASDLWIDFDNIIAANGFHLQCCISKGTDGPWYPIRYIDGTTVKLGTFFYWNTGMDMKYCGVTSASASTYGREAIPFDCWGDSTNPGLLQDSGSDTGSNLIKFRGGFDTGSTTQNGYSWFTPRIQTPGNGQNHLLLDMNNKDYLQIERICGLNFSWGTISFRSGGLRYSILKDIHGAGINGGPPGSSYNRCVEVVLEGDMTFSQFNSAPSLGGADIYFQSMRGPANVTIHCPRDYSECVYVYLAECFFTGKWTFASYGSGNYGTLLYLKGNYLYFREIEIMHTDKGIRPVYGTILHIDKVTVGDDVNYAFSQGMGPVRVGTYSGSPATGDIYWGWHDLDSGSSSGSIAQGIAIDRYKADNRFKKSVFAGVISDHITAGQSAGWAFGGSGLSLVLSPAYSKIPLIHTFYIAVNDTAAQELSMQVIKTSSGATCTMKVDISGCGITKIDQESVTLTDSWAEYVSTSFTPTYKGFLRVDVYTWDGGTTGDIGIDAVKIQAA
jgi:hypothetical protein